jgi:hypothetical protein
VNTDADENYRQVTVWVNGPKRDGAVLREETGAVAHKHCVDLMKAGQSPDQTELFSEDWRDPGPTTARIDPALISDEPGKVYKVTGPDSLHEALTKEEDDDGQG